MVPTLKKGGKKYDWKWVPRSISGSFSKTPLHVHGILRSKTTYHPIVGIKEKLMKKIISCLFLIVWAAFAIPAHAQQGKEWSFEAIVEVRITVPENARTAAMFGTNRVAGGVVIDKKGHILTIGFQTLEARTVEIVDLTGKKIPGEVVAYDSVTGFGLLRAKSPLDITPMLFGDSSEIRQGDPLLAVGYGGKESVQGVIVAARQEFAGSWEYLLENAIFTSPPITQFSGAALINRNGRLVGIGYLFNQLAISGIGTVSTNMFIPIDLIKPILDDLKRSGQTRLPARPWLGVRTQEIHGRVIVERVRPGGPSEKAGIKTGDIILAVNDQAVQGMADLYRKVWALGNAGVNVPLTVLQGTNIRKLIVPSSVRRLPSPPKQEEKRPLDQII